MQAPDLKHYLSQLKASIFKHEPVRRRAIFEVKHSYYPELEFGLELGRGLRCPFWSAEAGCSFSEIFFEGEYEPVFAEIDLPDRWLDLGCHYGFFSLYVAWLRAKQGLNHPFQSLLVDADERVLPGVHRLCSANHWHSQVKVLHGAIAEGVGSVSFHEQPFMSSVLNGMGVEDPLAHTKIVPIVDQHTILATLPPPYDLVKIDVEGGEYDFLAHYEQVIERAQHLVLEWHSWHRGGGSEVQIVQLAEQRGLKLARVVRESSCCGGSLSNAQVGVLLFSRA